MVTIVALSVLLIVTGNARKPEALRRAGLLALAVTLCWMSLSLGTARFDFYRRLARDLERQGRPEQALAADPSLARGVNVQAGRITHAALAEVYGSGGGGTH